MAEDSKYNKKAEDYAEKQVCIIYFNALKGQFCNRDSIPIVTMLPYKLTDTNSICYEVHQKAKDILEGRKHDPTF